MTTPSFGDASDWAALFDRALVPDIIAHILATWDKMDKPAQNEWETDISKRLHSALVNAKDRNKHAFLILLEAVEMDTLLVEEVGRKDIVFYPLTNDETIYFCLEAKRLNALVSGEKAALADKYVTEGMLRFVIKKYSKHVRHGAMAGYVLDGDISRAITNIEGNLQTYLDALKMKPPAKLGSSTIRPADPCVRETLHQREGDTAPFRMHHLFLLCPRTRGPTATVAPPRAGGAADARSSGAGGQPQQEKGSVAKPRMLLRKPSKTSRRRGSQP